MFAVCMCVYVCVLGLALSFDFCHARMKIVFLLFRAQDSGRATNKGQRLLTASENYAMDYDAANS